MTLTAQPSDAYAGNERRPQFREVTIVWSDGDVLRVDPWGRVRQLASVPATLTQHAPLPVAVLRSRYGDSVQSNTK